MTKISPTKKYLKKKARIRSTGFPIGTVAYYGPTDQVATKVAVGIFDRYDNLIEMKRWFTSEEDDIRLNVNVSEQIVEFLQIHDVYRIAMTDRIIGCPHEEGIDYPEGKACPECKFWEGRDRWTGELYH